MGGQVRLKRAPVSIFLAVGREFERGAVHAIARAGWLGSIAEHVDEMGVARNTQFTSAQ
jgi:hypothetical protein